MTPSYAREEVAARAKRCVEIESGSLFQAGILNPTLFSWLAEIRQEKERREAMRFWLILGVATAPLIVTAQTYCMN